MQALPLRAVSPFLAVRGAAAVAVGAAGRAGASSLPGGARRAAGGGKFAAFKVKKANWVEVRASVYLGLCGLLRAAKQTRSRAVFVCAPPLAALASPRVAEQRNFAREPVFHVELEPQQHGRRGGHGAGLPAGLSLPEQGRARAARRRVRGRARAPPPPRAPNCQLAFWPPTRAPPRRPSLAATAAWISRATTSEAERGARLLAHAAI